MAENDSRGFVEDESGRFWGLFGAGGVLLRCPSSDAQPLVLLQHRSIKSLYGDTWSIPGGARDSHENSTQAAVRELYEETGIEESQFHVRSSVITYRSTSGWTYTTVIAECEHEFPLNIDQESIELRWVPEEKVRELNLHPDFSSSWNTLKIALYVNYPLINNQRLICEGSKYLWNHNH